jgi:hypothetical protein
MLSKMFGFKGGRRPQDAAEPKGAKPYRLGRNPLGSCAFYTSRIRAPGPLFHIRFVPGLLGCSTVVACGWLAGRAGLVCAGPGLLVPLRPWLTGWLAGWLAGLGCWLARWLWPGLWRAGWAGRWLAGWLAGWLGLAAGWLAGSGMACGGLAGLAAWPSGWLAVLVCWLARWLAGWWLAGWAGLG